MNHRFSWFHIFWTKQKFLIGIGRKLHVQNIGLKERDIMTFSVYFFLTNYKFHIWRPDNKILTVCTPKAAVVPTTISISHKFIQADHIIHHYSWRHCVCLQCDKYQREPCSFCEKSVRTGVDLWRCSLTWQDITMSCRMLISSFVTIREMRIEQIGQSSLHSTVLIFASCHLCRSKK